MSNIINMLPANIRRNWPTILSGTLAWIMIIAAMIPAISQIIKYPGLAPTIDDLKEAPGLSSTGSSILAPITGPLGIQNALSQPVTVNQGDYIDVGLTKCTVGYIDHAADRIYTAGHCANDNTYTARLDNKPLGQFRTVKEEGTLSSHLDVGYIIPHNNVTLGKNTYTTDTVLDENDIHLGDTLCSYGGRSKTIQCANIESLTDLYASTRGTAGGGAYDMLSGDSGGPAWIINPDGSPKGLVGFNSHISGDGQTGAVNWNSYGIFNTYLKKPSA